MSGSLDSSNGLKWLVDAGHSGQPAQHMGQSPTPARGECAVSCRPVSLANSSQPVCTESTDLVYSPACRGVEFKTWPRGEWVSFSQIDKPLRELIDLRCFDAEGDSTYQIDNIHLTARARHCFMRANILTVGELLSLSPKRLMQLPNFGITSLADVVIALSTLVPNLPDSVPAASNATTNDSLLAMPIERLGLCHRAYTRLVRIGVRTVGELVRLSGADLLRLPGFGQLTLDRVRTALRSVGLCLSDDSVDQDIHSSTTQNDEKSLAAQLEWSDELLSAAQNWPLGVLDLPLRLLAQLYAHRFSWVVELASSIPKKLFACGFTSAQLKTVLAALSKLDLHSSATLGANHSNDAAASAYRIDWSSFGGLVSSWFAAVRLPDAHQLALRLYFGLNGQPAMTYRMIARQLGCSAAVFVV